MKLTARRCGAVSVWGFSVGESSNWSRLQFVEAKPGFSPSELHCRGETGSVQK